MRRLASLIGVLALLAAVLCLPAYAVEDTPDIATLTNRYDSIDNLDGTSDTSSQQVTGTRIGVLTAVNRALDGATVSFTGEAVGDIIEADDGHKWVTLLSGGASIGVYMSAEDAEVITHLGNYSTTGTTLTIKGVYHIACADHQGELDVHADEVSVVESGGSVVHTASKNDLLQGLALVVVGFALLLVFYVLRHARKRGKHDA